MNFLYTVPAEKAVTDDGTPKAPAGEPAVPWFPTAPANMFVGMTSWGFAPYAEVQNRQDVDLDLYLRRLSQQYPGLPEELHKRYILETAKTAANFKEGTRFQVFIDADSAKLKVIDHDVVVTLWTKQPIEG